MAPALSAQTTSGVNERYDVSALTGTRRLPVQGADRVLRRLKLPTGRIGKGEGRSVKRVYDHIRVRVIVVRNGALLLLPPRPGESRHHRLTLRAGDRMMTIC